MMSQNPINTAPKLANSTRDIVTSDPAKGINEYAYSVVKPFANYSPWITDLDFQKIHSKIKSHTLVDHYRLYELWQLCEQLKHVEGDVLEVGVWRGGSAVLIANRFASLNIQLAVYAADTFKGVVKVTEADPSYKGGEHHETSVDIVQFLAHEINHKPIEILAGIFPDDTGDVIANNRFRLVHIDVDIYQSGKDVLEWVWPRLNIGGVVVFDDYGFSTCQGITKLVNQNKDNLDRLVLHNLNGHAVMIKLK